jgi:3-dehydroquinate synthase
MVLAHQFSAKLGLAPAADAKRAAHHLAEVGLPTKIRNIPGERLDAEALLALMYHDKKVTRGKLTFILTRGIGKAFVANDVANADVSKFLEEAVAL